jgi:hypothetical protein
MMICTAVENTFRGGISGRRNHQITALLRVAVAQHSLDSDGQEDSLSYLYRSHDGCRWHATRTANFAGLEPWPLSGRTAVSIVGFVFASMTLVIAILIGLGSILVPWSWRLDISVFDYAIFGLLVVSIVGLIANMFMPVHMYLCALTALAGLMTAVIKRRQLWESFHGRQFLMLGVVCGLIGMSTIGAIITPMNYDTGLYHLQAIQWLEYSTRVFGLANLHYRLGFNTLWFIIVVMFDFGRHNHSEIFLINSVVLVVVIGALISPPPGDAKLDGPDSFSTVFAACIVVVLLTTIRTWAFDSIFSSPGYDFPAALMVIYSFCAFLRTYERPSIAGHHFLCLAAASMIAVMIRLSAAPVLLLLPASLYLVVFRDGWSLTDALRNRVVVCLVLVSGLWIASGIISSGCLAFPIAMTCIPSLPWTVSIHDARQVEVIIMAWARHPTQYFLDASAGWSWLVTWPKTMLAFRPFLVTSAISYAFVIVVGVGIGLWDRSIPKMQPRDSLARFRDSGQEVPTVIVYTVLVSCAGNALWFLAAPDPRFGAGFLIVLPALLAASGAWWLSSQGRALAFVCSRPSLACAVLACASTFILGNWSTAAQALPSWPQVPVVAVREQQFGPSFRANVPISGDQCWDAPRPCTPGGNAGALAIHERDWLLWHLFEQDTGPVRSTR